MPTGGPTFDIDCEEISGAPKAGDQYIFVVLDYEVFAINVQ